MKHLLSCLKTYRAEVVLAPLFKFFEACMELLVPLVVAAILDVGVKNGDRAYVVHACLLIAAFGVAGLGFALTAQYFAAKAAVGTSAALRQRLFSKLQTLSYARIDDMGYASMVTRMTSDTNQVQTGVNMTLRIFLRSPIVVFGAMAMAFVVDARVGLVFAAAVPVLAAVVFAVMAVCMPRYRRVQEDLDGIYLSAHENLAGARVIRAFRREGEERAEFEAKRKKLERAQVGVGRIAGLTAPVTHCIVNLAVIALIYTGALRVQAGVLEQGQVVALYNYLALILVELIKFANLIVTTAKAVSCAGRIGAVLDLEGEPSAMLPPEAPVEGAPLVTFENVGFTYEGGAAPALSRISFTAERGQTVGILGGTGSGKTTLVHLLPRFYEATEGRVLLEGRDVRSVDAAELRRRIGFVPQKTTLFSGTVASNLRWGDPAASDERLLRAAEIAQASDVIEVKGGLDGPIMQGGHNLSGGQRQRLAIARALVKDPEILVLDDSASALDYATEARLRAALSGLDATVFIVSQRVASVMCADKILVLDEGHIADMGTHDELLGRCELYREIYASQREDA